MRIDIEKPLVSDQGAMVRIAHPLPNGGREETVYLTNHVLRLSIQGYGDLQIDLTREDPDQRVIFTDAIADGNSRR